MGNLGKAKLSAIHQPVESHAVKPLPTGTRWNFGNLQLPGADWPRARKQRDAASPFSVSAALGAEGWKWRPAAYSPFGIPGCPRQTPESGWKPLPL